MLYAALRASTARHVQEKFGQAQPLPRIAAEKDGSSTNGRTKYFSRAGLRGNVQGLGMLGHLRFVTPELKPNIVMLLIVFTNVETSFVEPVTKGK